MDKIYKLLIGSFGHLPRIPGGRYVSGLAIRSVLRTSCVTRFTALMQLQSVQTGKLLFSHHLKT
jgi:hypothetical protein